MYIVKINQHETRQFLGVRYTRESLVKLLYVKSAGLARFTDLHGILEFHSTY